MTRGTHAFKPVAVAAIAAIAVASLGALMTELGPWYFGLRKPAWQPPDWLFGPAWTLIFACAAAAGAIGWRAMRTASARALMLALFALNAALNVAWTVLFFRLHRPDWALVEVAFLWVSIVLLAAAIAPSSRRAGLLLVPYLLWVSFAAVLNAAIVRLNSPFVAS